MQIKDRCRRVKKGFEVSRKILADANKECTMRTAEIVLTLENAEKLRQEMQLNFRKYVRDKKIRLRKRFEVWSKFCDKTLHTIDYIPLLDKLAKIGLFVPDYDYITWQDILLITDCKDEKEQIMELLIEENFGTRDVRPYPACVEEEEEEGEEEDEEEEEKYPSATYDGNESRDEGTHDN